MTTGPQAPSCASPHGGRPLVSVAEALALVLAEAVPLAATRLPLSEARGCVLAEDAASDVDVPPFARCAMDGVAVRAEDAARPDAELTVIGVVHAGEVFARCVRAGEAVKVMTGAPLPDGCDAVVPVEHVTLTRGRVTLHEAARKGRHVSPRAEDLAAGAVALSAGELIGPAQVALLAVVGKAVVSVHRRPSATVLSTGDELVNVAEVPGPGSIRNSNAPMLAAVAAELGCANVLELPPARDDRASLEAALTRGLEADVLLVSGGVSKGEKDLVGDVLAALGVRLVFHGVALQPGKPLWFGVRGTCLVFALPGNPVSSLVTARLFAGTAIRRLRGVRDPLPRRWPARLTAAFRRHGAREGYLPARVGRDGDGLVATPLDAHGSADLVAACGANALWVAPQGRDAFAAGDAVDVLLAPDAQER